MVVLFSEIWQAAYRHDCWDACKILEQSNYFKTISRGFETFQGFALRRLIQEVIYRRPECNSMIHFSNKWHLKLNELFCPFALIFALQWRHNGRDSVSNHQPHDCLLKGVFRRRSKKAWKLRVTGLCAGKSPGTGEFPAQMASNAENVSIWWRHHGDVMIALKIFQTGTLIT